MGKRQYYSQGEFGTFHDHIYKMSTTVYLLLLVSKHSKVYFFIDKRIRIQEVKVSDCLRLN